MYEFIMKLAQNKVHQEHEKLQLYEFIMKLAQNKVHQEHEKLQLSIYHFF